LLEAEISSAWLQTEVDGRRVFRRFAAERLPLRLHTWRGAPPDGLVCRWQGGGLTVRAVQRPRGAMGWMHEGGLGAIVNGVFMADARFGQDDLGLRVVPEREGLASLRVVFSSRLNTFGTPTAVWGFDAWGAFCTLRFKGVNVTQTFRYIEPGSFLMGSPESEPGRDSDEGPRHAVTLTRGCWLADTPCTQALWMAVMGGQNPSHFKDGADAADCPVENVTWDEVQAFLAGLQALLPAGVEAALPTEAEWEHATRAGTETAYAWGDAPDAERANMGNKVNRTTPVKRYPPNPWGLYDVHGNVWEWCADAKRTYRDRPEVDPTGGAEGDIRVLRGGSWLNPAAGDRSAYRFHARRGSHWHVGNGFRLALRSTAPAQPGLVGPGGPDPVAGRRPATAAGGSPGPAEPGRPRPKRPKRGAR
jgi:formylglycine-generating enzyme required for sulfatase activity